MRNAVSDTDFAPQGRESGVTVLLSVVNFNSFGIGTLKLVNTKRAVTLILAKETTT